MSIGQRIKARRLDLKLKQHQLAEAAGVTQATVSDWEAGKFAPSRETIKAVADFLKTTPAMLEYAIEDAPPAEPNPPGEDLIPAPMLSRHEMPLDVPVYGTAVGGSVGDFQLNGQTVDYIRRPPALRNALKAFAIFYANDSMFPAFEAGDPLYVNPAIPPRAGDYIIIEMAPGRTGEPGAAYVKRLVKKTEKTLIVAQYNPPRDDMKFEMAKVKAVWRIVPTRELLGV